MSNIHSFYLHDNIIFPNSHLPVLHYRSVLDIPAFFGGRAVKNLFRRNGWSNNWRSGIYTYHHYHSITHEVIGVIKGKTILQLGGEDGVKMVISKGDVVIIPAGVAHKNLGNENDVTCIGGYPCGRDYDMNYGRVEERPRVDDDIALLPLPAMDPVWGKVHGLVELWKDGLF